MIGLCYVGLVKARTIGELKFDDCLEMEILQDRLAETTAQVVWPGGVKKPVTNQDDLMEAE